MRRNVPELLPLVGDGLRTRPIWMANAAANRPRAPDRRDAGRQCRLRRDIRRTQHLGSDSLSGARHPIAPLDLDRTAATAPLTRSFHAPDARDCLPQPGIVNPAQFLGLPVVPTAADLRLAYRNFSTYERLVTNQSVEAAPGVAGARGTRSGGQARHPRAYSIYQQGTYAPDDGVHRWMGSVAMDKKGNMALVIA